MRKIRFQIKTTWFKATIPDPHSRMVLIECPAIGLEEWWGVWDIVGIDPWIEPKKTYRRHIHLTPRMIKEFVEDNLKSATPIH